MKICRKFLAFEDLKTSFLDCFDNNNSFFLLPMKFLDFSNPSRRFFGVKITFINIIDTKNEALGSFPTTQKDRNRCFEIKLSFQ